MEISKTLRRPANWQDFETLCKKLWGEIWACPEIKKNGRSGQVQHGVDVYGMPYCDDGYYGIQCKGKDEYTNSQFTEGEILEELEKVKLFQPNLKKLYLATTAVKDAKIEEFVRKKNLEFKSADLFEIHIFSWEDIVDLIDENKQTYDWYVKSQNYKTQYEVSVAFQNGLTEMACRPKFRRKGIYYTQEDKISTQMKLAQAAVFQLHNRHMPFMNLNIPKTEINLSYVEVKIDVTNIGEEPIEDWKLLFEFDGGIEDLTYSNEKKKFPIITPYGGFVSNTVLSKDSLTGAIIPKKVILVSEDCVSSDLFFIKTCPQKSTILIKWKLISKRFKDRGELVIQIDPDIQNYYEKVIIQDPLNARIEYGEVEDYLVDKE